MVRLLVNAFSIISIFLVFGDVKTGGCYESETHRRRQERQSEARVIRSVETPPPTRES